MVPSDVRLGSSDSQRSVKLFLWLSLGVLVLFGWAAWTGDYSYDDRQVLESPLIHGDGFPWRAFGQDYWHHRGDAGIYRPFVTISLWAQGKLGGVGARALHVLTLLLHLWVVVLAASLWAPRSGRKWAVWLGCLLFAWHPVQTEVAVWIAGRSSSLAALLGLLPLLAWGGRTDSDRHEPWGLHVHRPNAWFPLLAFLGVLGPLLVKEDGVAFAAFYWVLAKGAEPEKDATEDASKEANRKVGSKWRIRIGVLAALCIYAALRFQALPGMLIGSGAAPLAGMGFWERLSVGLQAHYVGVRALFQPLDTPLAPDQAFLERARLGLGSPVALLLLVVIFYSKWKTHRAAKGPATPLQHAALAGLAFSLLPWLQVLPAPELFGLRSLYLPLLFLIPLWPRWFGWTKSHIQWVESGKSSWWHLSERGVIWLGSSTVWCLVPLALCFAGTAVLSKPYTSALGFWEYRSRVEPERAEVWNGMGTERWRSGDATGAKEAFLEAVRIRPNYSKPWGGLAIHAESQGNLELAGSYLDQSIEANSRNPVALANRGRLHRRAGEAELALPLYERACLLQPGRVAFWRGLGHCHFDLGNEEDAHTAYQRALALSPTDAGTLKLLDKLMDRP